MLAILFLLILRTQAITYNEMKEYNCHTPRDRENSRDLRCGVAINEHEQCEEMCRTAETVAKRDSNPGNIYKGLVGEGAQLCEITFSARCASKTFKNDDDDLCFIINTKPLGYNQAVLDCEDNDGRLYVPNSDNDLRRLISLFIIQNLTDSKIDKFWFGGGSIFFRTCRDASMGKSEEVAVQYIITKDDKQYVGYGTTRETSDKAPYICAKPRSKNNGNCLSFKKTTVPTVPPTKPPPQCSFKQVNVGTSTAPVYVYDACLPGGPLNVGDTIEIQGIMPPCCPPGIDNPGYSLWSINIFSYNKSPLLHMSLPRSWQQIGFASSTEGWGKFKNEAYYPCPFRADTQFKIEITNTFNHLAFTMNTYSYTYPHAAEKGKTPINLYYSIGLAISRQFKVWSVTLIRNKIRTEIGLGAVNFTQIPS